MSAGIMSGVNWMRENGDVDGLADRSHQHRLAEPRHAFQHDVAAGEQGGQSGVDARAS